MAESLAGMSLFVVVLVCLAERPVLVGDVVLVPVVLDGVRCVVPSPTLVAVVRVRPEGAANRVVRLTEVERGAARAGARAANAMQVAAIS